MYNMNLRDGLVLYWKLDGDSNDSLSINNGSDTNIVYTNGKLKDCASFDGASSYISSPGNGLPTGGQSRTYSAWVFPVSYTGPNGIIIYAGNSSSPPNQSFCLYQTEISGLYYIFSDGYNGDNNLTVPIQDLAVLNEWSFICFTLDGSKYSYYLNGTLRLTGNFIVPINTNGTSFVVGNRQDSYVGYWDGQIDEVGVWNRALSSDEVFKLYNNGIGRQYSFEKTLVNSTTNLEENLVAYWKLNGNSNDIFGLKNGVDTNIIYESGKVGECARFDGATSVIKVGDSNDYFLGTRNFGICAWVKRDVTGVRHVVFCQVNAFGADNTLSFNFEINNLNNLTFNIYDGIIVINASSVAISDTDWHFISVTRRGNFLDFYKDGFLGDTLPFNYTLQDSIYNMAIGAPGDYAGGLFFQGLIDEVGFWHRTLTQRDILSLYNNGVGRSHPFQKLPITNNASLAQGLISYWKLDGDSNDAINSNNGTDTNVSYISGKIGQSASFNGTTSKILIPGKVANSSQGTISCWVKFNSLGNTEYIYGYGGDSNQALFGIQTFDVGGGNFRFWIAARDAAASFLNLVHGSTNLTTGVWYHVVFQSNGILYTMYVNGVAETLTVFTGLNDGKWNDIVTTTNDYTSIGTLVINADMGNTYLVDATIDEVAVWDRELTEGEVTQLYNNGKATQYPFFTNLLKH